MRFFLRWLIILSLVGVLQSSLIFAETAVLFSSDQSIQEALLKEIESTQSTIDLAVREITSQNLAQALVRAKGRGVTVRVITDSKQAKMKSSKITSLIQEGISVKVLKGKDYGVMNHRFVIFDGKKAVTGSFDWSEASGKWNDENILILSETEVVLSYQKEFERLWREKRVIR
jgi:phosphatidylserine/phosphatidylglycerophosphate/cardiolipin synthase-like enzyme